MKNDIARTKYSVALFYIKIGETDIKIIYLKLCEFLDHCHPMKVDIVTKAWTEATKFII